MRTGKFSKMVLKTRFLSGLPGKVDVEKNGKA